MKFFTKLKDIFPLYKKTEDKMNDIKITDSDILYSLNYNIVIRRKFYKNISNNIIFEEYKKFKYLEEMKDYYNIENETIIFYIDKFEKFKQLINNILIYLEIDNKDKIMYDCRNYSLFANIFEILSKEKEIEKKFDFMKFFSRFDWVKDCENYRDISIKVNLCDNNNIEIRYKIIEKNTEYILGVFRDEFIKIDFVEKKIYFGLKFKNGV